jgi:hypothetical protein
MSWCDIQLGNVAEWLAAILAGGAVVAAAIVIRNDRHALADAKAEQARSQAERDRAQAVQVAAWCEDVVREPHLAFPVSVANPTAQAVRDVRAWLDPALVSDNVPLRTFGLWLPVLAPRTLARTVLRLDHDHNVAPNAVVMPAVFVEFTDDRGVRWLRDGQGLQRLEQTEEDPAWSRDLRAHEVVFETIPGSG